MHMYASLTLRNEKHYRYIFHIFDLLTSLKLLIPSKKISYGTILFSGLWATSDLETNQKETDGQVNTTSTIRENRIQL